MEHARAPRTEDVDDDGRLHPYVETPLPERFGFDRTGEAALVELVMTRSGAVTASELARGAIDGAVVLRGAASDLHVHLRSAARWADGTVIEAAPPYEASYMPPRGGRVDREASLTPRDVFTQRGGAATEVVARSDELAISRRDADGRIAWESRWPVRSGGEATIEVVAVELRPDGRTLLDGRVRGAVELGAALAHISTGNGDAFLAELDPCGALSWARAFPGSGDEAAIVDFAVGPDGQLLGILETRDASTRGSVLLRIGE